jgi:hypothetical protein
VEVVDREVGVDGGAVREEREGHPGEREDKGAQGRREAGQKFCAKEGGRAGGRAGGRDGRREVGNLSSIQRSLSHTFSPLLPAFPSVTLVPPHSFFLSPPGPS